MKKGGYILFLLLAAMSLHGQDKTAYNPASIYNRGGEKVVILRMSDNASPTEYDLKNEARKYREFAPNTVVFFRKDAYIMPDNIQDRASYQEARNKAINGYHYAVYERTADGGEKVIYNSKYK